MGHDHRMAGRVAQAGVEADRAQILDQPLAGAPAVRSIGGIGRDRGNAQQREEPLEAGVEIGVEVVENSGKWRHCRIAFRICAATLVHQGIEWDRVLSAFSGKTAEIQRIRNKTGQENAAVAEGTTTAALLQTMRQPGEGG